MRSQKFLTVPVLLFAAVSLFSSCKKDDASPAQTCNIITVTPNSGSAFNITYNSSGKPETITIGTTVSVFAYSNNLIVINTTSNGNFSTKKTVTLNANGLASNVKTETSADGSTWYNDAYEFSGTELIKDTYTNSQGVVPEVTTVTWSGGNLASTTLGNSISTVEYFTDKASQPGDYLSLNQLIQGYHIYKTKNLVKSVVTNGNISSFDYTYQDGKITSMKYNSGGVITTYNYQYQCN